ncbi:hypothetical protein HFO56_02580 [Rhizobium laguerreae]|uniref:hypothetical protein n=1 Tax=Rhizobium laguerreae TaxID=1076926 RepID=UPI001C90FA91|nr:hypothetical protein [Rhizobium laguerreae]MBY3151271.1 hypothetical protein [Rhizobium laguerreae]MBY3433463.1 hypothetical protein [Rhizobium laguerreae]
MHTVCDVRNLNLYKDLAPAEIWRTYRRALNQALDSGDKTRAYNPDFGRQPEYA